MLYRNAPALLIIAAMLCFSGCVCTHSSVCGPGVGACDPCGDCAAGTCGHGYLAESAKSCLTCGSGCGEVYWGEWTNSPPDCCDPCGGCDPCCSPWAPLRGLANLWGYRYAPACGTCGGCDTCGGSGEMYMSEEMYMPGGYMPTEMETYETVQPPVPKPEPTKAASLNRPVRQASHTVRVRR